MTDDSQLLARYANEGDVRSLSELVDAHTRWLMAYLRGALPTESDAEDAFQEAWMRVIRFCGSYRGGSVRGYLARVARSVVTDRFRRGGPPSISLDTSSDEEDAPSADLADGAPSPGEAFELRATSEDVRRAVRALPERLRDVVLLRIEGELTFQEIADELGVPLGTVLTWMRSATARLKKTLGEKR